VNLKAQTVGKNLPSCWQSLERALLVWV